LDLPYERGDLVGSENDVLEEAVTMKTGINLAVPGALLLLTVCWSCGPGGPAIETAGPSFAGSQKGMIPAAVLDEILIVAAVDPLEKVFRESTYFPDEHAEANVARGEYASFQFVLRSGKNIRNLTAELEPILFGKASLTGATAKFVGYVKVSRRTPDPSRDRLTPLSGYFPDPLLERPAVDVPRDNTQPVWVTVPVPQDAVPGMYQGRITFGGTVEGKAFRLTRPFTVNVFPVTITRSRLWVTNWFFTDPGTLKFLNHGQPVEKGSSHYWELVRMLARMMKAYRQNIAWVHPLDLVRFSQNDDIWSFDFSEFDKMVGVLMEEGVVGRIEGGHIGGRESTWESQFVVNVPVPGPESTVLEKHTITDPVANNFYTQFIPALMLHLKDRGWDGIYMQHIADEPIPMNTRSYVEIASFIRTLAPGLKIVEACHSKDVDNIINIWVPQLDFFSSDYAFYQERQQAGDEVWFYTCLAPQGEFPNRFIELPLLKTRYIHWLNYKYGATGYLHWGLNYWQNAGEGNPYGETTGIIMESGNVLPGGDSWIVYPDNGRLASSIRLEAMRDGLHDYELLEMLEEKRPEKAHEITSRLVFEFTNCDLDIRSFRRARKEILELLSQ
jgi:hypothetical protein